MAPKRRSSSGGKVVGSVVKTKVVQETVEVTTAVVTDGEPAEQPLAPVAVAPPPTVDVSSSKVVHVVEVTTPDGNTTTTTANKRRRGVRREDEKHATPADSAPPVTQSQETQDPNEEQPETPRVASERKTKTTATKTKTKPQQQKEKANKTKTKAGHRRRRRLGEASRGGDAAAGGVGGYKRYLWRVLKQVHPELGVSGNAMRVLDMFMADMFERLAGEAARLSMASGRATVGSREVQSAVRLVLPGELGRHAMSEGTKAVAKYMSYDA
ncbi:hypothetical protein HU200_047906 [Digitaria exilis]|uniref:Core Histone H2A/H2B/H3 domain-containing protein n=1 Tax=Digitaria exilis TaxID=1010633 RepID=A0A835AVV8_9POAL|nr:hypothetical protein HU200_047906 [Digitaria exilis]